MIWWSSILYSLFSDGPSAMAVLQWAVDCDMSMLFGLCLDRWISLGNQLDGVRLMDPDLRQRFREKYPGIDVQPSDAEIQAKMRWGFVINTKASCNWGLRLHLFSCLHPFFMNPTTQLLMSMKSRTIKREICVLNSNQCLSHTALWESHSGTSMGIPLKQGTLMVAEIVGSSIASFVSLISKGCNMCSPTLIPCRLCRHHPLLWLLQSCLLAIRSSIHQFLTTTLEQRCQSSFLSDPLSECTQHDPYILL